MSFEVDAVDAAEDFQKILASSSLKSDKLCGSKREGDFEGQGIGEGFAVEGGEGGEEEDEEGEEGVVESNSNKKSKALEFLKPPTVNRSSRVGREYQVDLSFLPEPSACLSDTDREGKGEGVEEDKSVSRSVPE